MRTLLQQTGDAELKPRSRAMECVGHMIEAVGREQCEDAVRESTAFALSGLNGLPELREYTFGFFAQLGDVIGDELAPLLPALLPACVAALESDETLEWRGGAKDDTLATLAKLHGGGEGDDDDDDDDDDDEDGRRGGSRCERPCSMRRRRRIVWARARRPPPASSTRTWALRAVLACADYFHERPRRLVPRDRQLVGACAAAEIAPIDQGAWVRGGAVGYVAAPAVVSGAVRPRDGGAVRSFANGRGQGRGGGGGGGGGRHREGARPAGALAVCGADCGGGGAAAHAGAHVPGAGTGRGGGAGAAP